MSVTNNGFAATANPSRYIQQLCKHWSHKFETEFDTQSGTIHFSETTVVMLNAQADGIAIAITMTDETGIARIRGAVEKHLDRFAFREAPLAYQWDDLG